MVSDFAVTVTGNSGAARFTLTETGGVSGATIKDVTVSTPKESDSTGESCWRERIHVDPGGTLDAFNEGWETLAYCAPSIVGPISGSVLLTVTFVDDQGVTGTISSTTSTIIR